MTTVFIWGAQFPIGKSVLATLDAWYSSAIRYAIASVVLAGILYWSEGRGAFAYYGRLAQVSLAAFCGFTFSGLAVFAGLQRTQPEQAAIIIALQPALASLAAWLCFKRRPTRFALGCIVVAFVGVTLVVTRGELSFRGGGTELLGDILVLLGSIMWIVYNILSEGIHGWSPLRYTTLALIPGTLGIILVTAFLTLTGHLTPPAWGNIGSVVPQLAFLGVFGLAISIVSWTAGVRHVGVASATLFTSLVPIVAFSIRVAQGARFSAIEIFGAGLVVAALIANNLWNLRSK